MQPIDFWRQTNGVRHITPAGKMWPEGEWFQDYVNGMDLDGTTVDYGCGPGRLSHLFNSDLYIGVDVNPLALAVAREQNPAYRYELLLGKMKPPKADMYFVHTVLLHIPDDEIEKVIRSFQTNTVFLSEILGRELRREGPPPAFNRELEDYIEIFGKCGFDNVSYFQKPYEHYKDAKLSFMQFERANA